MSRRLEQSYALEPEIDWFSRKDGLELFPFVQAGVRYVRERRGSLVADPVARRKIAVLGSEEHVGYVRGKRGSARILVICDAEDEARWRKKMEKYHAFPFSFLDGPLAVAADDRDGIFIVRWTMLHRIEGISDLPWDLLIADSVHHAARACDDNPSKRGVMVLGNPRQGLPPAIKARKKVFLSPKPINRSPLEIFALGNALSPGVHGTFGEFARFVRFGWKHVWLRTFGKFDDSVSYLSTSTAIEESDWAVLSRAARDAYLLRRPRKAACKVAGIPMGRRYGKAWTWEFLDGVVV